MSDGWTRVSGGERADSTWKPEKAGDKLVGVLVSKQMNTGSRGNSNLYVIKTADGAKVGVWGSMVLDDCMSKIPEGMEVMITFDGSRKAKNGDTTYKAWTVDFRAPGAAPVETPSPAPQGADDLPF